MFKKLREFLILLKHFFLSLNSNFKLIHVDKVNNKLIILGNGPSLINDIDDILLKKMNYDFFAVNNFCSSNIYPLLKPKSYFFLDPIFLYSDANEKNLKKRNDIFNSLNVNTSWEMTVFVPKWADIEFLKKVIVNKNIKITSISFKDHSYFLKDNLIANFLIDSGSFMFPGINVLIFAIFLGIWSNYDLIEIYGADASFHLDTVVDENNNLIVENKHFNENNKKEICYIDEEKNVKCSMSVFLKMNYTHFKSHERLYAFAKRRNVKVINKSSFSLIDAYPRG